MRPLLALSAIWTTLVALITVGELIDLFPTNLLTSHVGRFIPDHVATSAGAFADLVPRSSKVVEWTKAIYASAALPLLAFVAVGMYRWAGRRDRADGIQDTQSVFARSSPLIGPTAIFALRLIRGVFYAGAAFQVVFMLPAVSWLLSPALVTGNMLAQLALKVAFFLACALMVRLLRKAIDAIHRRYYGIPHPTLSSRRFAL